MKRHMTQKTLTGKCFMYTTKESNPEKAWVCADYPEVRANLLYHIITR